jgi:hypothetical protein
MGSGFLLVLMGKGEIFSGLWGFILFYISWTGDASAAFQNTSFHPILLFFFVSPPRL